MYSLWKINSEKQKGIDFLQKLCTVFCMFLPLSFSQIPASLQFSSRAATKLVIGPVSSQALLGTINHGLSKVPLNSQKWDLVPTWPTFTLRHWGQKLRWNFPYSWSTCGSSWSIWDSRGTARSERGTPALASPQSCRQFAVCWWPWSYRWDPLLPFLHRRWWNEARRSEVLVCLGVSSPLSPRIHNWQGVVQSPGFTWMLRSAPRRVVGNWSWSWGVRPLRSCPHQEHWDPGGRLTENWPASPEFWSNESPLSRPALMSWWNLSCLCAGMESMLSSLYFCRLSSWKKTPT